MKTKGKSATRETPAIVELQRRDPFAFDEDDDDEPATPVLKLSKRAPAKSSPGKAPAASNEKPVSRPLADNSLREASSQKPHGSPCSQKSQELMPPPPPMAPPPPRHPTSTTATAQRGSTVMAANKSKAGGAAKRPPTTQSGSPAKRQRGGEAEAAGPRSVVPALDALFRGNLNMALQDAKYHLERLDSDAALLGKQNAIVQVLLVLQQEKSLVQLRSRGVIPWIMKKMLLAGHPIGHDNRLYCCAHVMAIAMLSVEPLDRRYISEAHTKVLLAALKRPNAITAADKGKSCKALWKDLYSVLAAKFPKIADAVEGKGAEVFPLKELALEALRLATEHNDVLQDPFRKMGGLEELRDRMRACCGVLQKSGGVLATLTELEQVGRVLESLTFRNAGNVAHLVHQLELMDPLCEVIQFCKKQLTEPCFEIDEESSHLAAVECISSMLRVLINLTNENAAACKAFANLDGLFITTECLMLFDADQYDLLVLALGLLINSTEHSEYNRLQMRSVRVKDTKSRRGPAQKIGAVAVISKLFVNLLQQQKQAMSKLSTSTDNPVDALGRGGTVKALGDALSSYVAMLIAVLSSEPDNRREFLEVLGEEDFKELTAVLMQHLKDQEDIGILTHQIDESIRHMLHVLDPAAPKLPGHLERLSEGLEIE